MIALRRSKLQTQRGVLTGKSPAIQLNVNMMFGDVDSYGALRFLIYLL
jgi:hypothetical protein